MGSLHLCRHPPFFCPKSVRRLCNFPFFPTSARQTQKINMGAQQSSPPNMTNEVVGGIANEETTLPPSSLAPPLQYFLMLPLSYLLRSPTLWQLLLVHLVVLVDGLVVHYHECYDHLEVVHMMPMEGWAA